MKYFFIWKKSVSSSRCIDFSDFAESANVKIFDILDSFLKILDSIKMKFGKITISATYEKNVQLIFSFIMKTEN